MLVDKQCCALAYVLFILPQAELQVAIWPCHMFFILLSQLMPRQAGASPWHGTLQEALWQMRWQIAGNLVLVILFFIYTSWLRYTGGSRPPQSESPNPGDVDLGRGSKL